MFKIFKKSQDETVEKSSAPTTDPAVAETPDSAPAENPPAGTAAEAPTAVPGEARPAKKGPVVLPPPQKKNVFYYLFSPAHRFGRGFRAFLRWAAAVTGLFSLGLVVGYLLLYQPLQRELDASQARLVQATQDAALVNKSQQSAQADRDQALKSLQQTQTDLKKAASQNSVLIVLVEVQNARVALVNKDGAAAKTNIELAQADLAKAMPLLRTQDPARADVLQPRLDLAVKELVSDPAAALADLDKLASDLTDLHKKLFLQ